MNYIYLRTHLQRLFKIWDERDKKSDDLRAQDPMQWLEVVESRLDHIREIIEYEPGQEENANSVSEAK